MLVKAPGNSVNKILLNKSQLKAIVQYRDFMTGHLHDLMDYAGGVYWHGAFCRGCWHFSLFPAREGRAYQ